MHKKGKKALSDIRLSVIRAGILSKEWWNYTDSVLDLYTEKRLESHRDLLRKLVATRQPGQPSPWIFSTNYDLAVEWAAESIDIFVINGFWGTHRRHFSPQSFDLGLSNTQTVGEARFGSYNINFVKLHGSLTWFENSGNFIEVQSSVAKEKIDSLFEDSLNPDPDEDGEIDNYDIKEKSYENLMVLPSNEKYSQTSGYFYGELFRRFEKFLASPQTSLVVIGYGFNDEHVNRMIKSALLNPTFQLVICLPEFTDICEISNLPYEINELINLKNPRITIIGGGESAYFGQIVKLLPEPAYFEEPNHNLRQKLLGK